MIRFIIGIEILSLASSWVMGNASELKELATTRYKFGGLIHVFDATYRAPLDTAHLDPLDEFPKELEFEYARNIGSEQLIGVAEKILKKSVPSAKLAEIEFRIKALNAAYQDVGRGDRYTLRYEPGKGTSLLLNGTVLHETPGDDFHRIYFSIWLGPKSPFDLLSKS